MMNGIVLLIYSLLKIRGSRVVHAKITVLSLIESSGLHAVVRPGVTYQNAMVPGKPFAAAFENGLTTEFSIISSDF